MRQKKQTTKLKKFNSTKDAIKNSNYPSSYYYYND